MRSYKDSLGDDIGLPWPYPPLIFHIGMVIDRDYVYISP
ncbi:MAG: hypothetical protein ACJAT2_003580 [Bacteriovoracaceae bacterium]|jgi:hypothetical protein